MPPQPQRKQLRRRRRRAEDTEDEASNMGRADDSQSEGSVLSDEDGDADDSDLSGDEKPESSLSPEDTQSRSNGQVKVVGGGESDQPPPGTKDATFTKSADTDLMMNGLKISEDTTKEEGLDFEVVQGPVVVSSDLSAAAPGATRRQESIADRKRKEHEEYKKKRDENPAFIPTRGAFFMHDQRSMNAPNGARILGRGRGRGVGGPYSPANLRPQPADATSSAWSHDLHETLEQPHARPGASQHAPTSVPTSNTTSHLPFAMRHGQPGQAPVRNFSTTRDVAHVQVRVRLPHMKEPVTFSNTRIRQYTKLPDHRPPLRRDKPVRISLPDKPPRYIFPAVDRSFIFIPRALRPNQQGFGRGRSKLGSMGGYSSRRTSVFGGSVYSPSHAAMSRRSSFAREFDRAGLVSPAGSVRPIVRMPPGSHHTTASGTPVGFSGHGTPVMNGPAMYRPGPPQHPQYRENWAASMPMHQPRPQKTVSVAGIESPASNFQPPPSSDLQPFSHQLPQGVSAPAPQPAGTFYPQQPYQGQTSGTPLSNIPERAVHAQAFQPYAQPGFQPGFYYPQMQPQMQYPQAAVVAPMVMQNGQQGSYLVPTIAPAQPAPPQQEQYANNGMVYYYDPSQMGQMYVPADGGQQYASYAMPVQGMGGIMTPAPDGNYYYQPQMPGGTVYYPQQ